MAWLPFVEALESENDAPALNKSQLSSCSPLTRMVRDNFKLSDRTYGSPRVWHDLKEAGEQCAPSRVARLMKRFDVEDRALR